MCLRSCFLLLALWLHPVLVLAQRAPILMDGYVDDWSPDLATFVDTGTPTAGIDLLSMQVTNDAQYLYIKLVVGTEIDLTDDLVPQTIRLYIDGDNNPATGTAVQTGYGAELQIRFDTRTVTEYWGASSNVSWSVIDLVPLPTITDDTFEIAIARNAKPDGVNDLFSSSTIKLLFRETDGGDQMPNTGSTFSYTFEETPVAPLVPVQVQKEQQSHIRIVAWNVLNDGLTNASREPAFQRILGALQPDVIGFSECANSTALQIKTRLDSWLPIGGAGWNVVKDDFNLIVASRWPIVQNWPALSRQFPVLIDLPNEYAADLLFTAAHLNCCTADATRQDQADAYVQFVQDAKSPGGVVDVPQGTVFVYAGDLNSVGYAQQLNTLLTGDIQDNATYGSDGPMDWDGTPFTRASCVQTDARMTYTWRNNTSAYPSGILDHWIYSDASASLTKSFTLRTAIMSSTTLSALGINAGDGQSASDHYPVVGDLNVPVQGVTVNVRAILEGPYVPGNGQMHDSLRVKGLLPITEPYTALGFVQVNGNGATTTSIAALNVEGHDAIVDWVLLELRTTATGPTHATRTALLQRDGDVVDVDGVSPVRFEVQAGNYHVLVRHRNHLGVMTADAVPVTASSPLVDLSHPGTAAYGSDATKTITGMAPVCVLWAGNTHPDGTLRYSGSGNDRDPILSRVGGAVPTNTMVGYWIEDVNMDGRVSYTGLYNDRDAVLLNIGGSVPTNIRAGQVP